MGKFPHGKVSTFELLSFLLGDTTKTIEASLSSGRFSATHFLRFGGRKLFDCGIDSAEVSWDIKDFMAFYSGAYWKLDQVV